MKKENKKKSVLTLYLQLLVTIVAIVFVVLYFINHKYINYLEITLGIDFFIMGINNKNFYKRENVTIVYYIFAVITVVLGIVGFING